MIGQEVKIISPKLCLHLDMKQTISLASQSKGQIKVTLGDRLVIIQNVVLVLPLLGRHDATEIPRLIPEPAEQL